MHVPALDLQGLSEEEFLRDYWQKRPCLIRGGLKGLQIELTPEELAGLACEEGVPARIIEETGDEAGWSVRHGPFTEADFAALPERDWTLLVTDMEKLLPELAALIEPFRFIPDWRIDDLMVSYAAPGGSVGPHTDAYDVFLVQLRGRREWRISERHHGREELRPNPDLQILAHFEESECWTVAPGDILYLPPGVPHWGIGLDDACMTASVGFRAPSWGELASGLFEHLLERPQMECRYSDPDLELRDHPAAILPQEIGRMRQKLEQMLSFDDREFALWLGGWLTRPTQPMEEPLPVETSIEDIMDHLRRGQVPERNPWARMLLLPDDRQPVLFANGERVDVPKACLPLAECLAARHRPERETLLTRLEQAPEGLELILALLRRGVLEWPDED
ncbi:MAG: cupin domain-containing protein [Gammaproteobacteria bacterium]|nr:MAG: cupin domain-containing protein [Gammaproteobacteria bacterium]